MAHANWISYGLSPLPRPSATVWFTGYPDADNNDPRKGRVTFQSLNQYAAWVFCMPETRIISRIGIQILQLNNGSNRKYELSLQALQDIGGVEQRVPSGTPIAGSGGPAKVDIYPTTVGFQWFNLEHTYTCQRGQYLAMVVTQKEVPPTGNGIEVAVQHGDYAIISNPYPLGSSEGQAGARKRYPGAIAIGFSGQSGGGTSCYGNPITAGIVGTSTNTLQTANVGERVAMRFKLPAGLASSFRVAGLKIQGSEITPGAVLGIELKLKMGLWRATPTPLLLQSLDLTVAKSYPAVPTTTPDITGWSYRELYFETNPLPWLSYDTVYYVGFEQVLTQAPSDTVPVRFDVVEVRERMDPSYPYDDMDAYAGGKEIYAAHYKQVSGVWQWVPFTYRRPLVDLILAEVVG